MYQILYKTTNSVKLNVGKQTTKIKKVSFG